MNEPIDAPTEIQLLALARSDEGVALARQACDPKVIFRSPARLDAIAQAFIARATDLGLEPGQWRVWGSLGAIEAGQGALRSPMIMLPSIAHAAKAIERLALAGAHPWTPAAFASRSRPGRLDVEAIHPLAMPGLATSDQFPLAVRKSLLGAAALHLPLEAAPSFFLALDKRWSSAAARANAGAQALLGDGDRALKALAQAITHCAEKLRQAASATEGRFDPPLQAPALVERLVQQAQSLLQVKASKTVVADPEKLKKSLDASQRAALADLRLACKSVHNPQERLDQVFAKHPWIAQEPMAACLRIARRESPMEMALRRRNLAALGKLRQIGSNIWLAAAQANQPNAARWALSSRLDTEGAIFQSGHWPEGFAQEVALLLLQGAWLNGGEDPKAICRELIQECLGDPRGKNDPRWPGYVAELASCCERAELEDALGALALASAPKARRAL